MIVIYITNSEYGMNHPNHIASDVLILPQNDWKIFKSYASGNFSKLEQGKIHIKELLVRDIKPSLLQYFNGLNDQKAHSYFNSIADNLLQKFRRGHNSSIQPNFRGRLIPKEDFKKLQKYLNSSGNSVKYFILYVKLWKSVKADIIIRERYETNIEMYYPDINILPGDMIYNIKSFLFSNV